MNRGELILKMACLAGYLLFTGFSAYFTASSLSLNLLNGTNLWLIFVLVLIVAIIASWCLTNVIGEMQKRIGASRATFAFSLIGFLLFWTFSFMTNVHYFFVEKHGYTILTKELASAKKYIEENTTKNNKNIEDQKHSAQMAVKASVQTNIESFGRELLNTMEHHAGFGEACISILTSTSNILSSDSKIYADKNNYTIFDKKRDSGDIGVTQRNRFPELYTKYTARMAEQLNKKLAVIEDFYDRKKNQNAELNELFDPISELEEKHLPAVLKDGSVDAFYKYNDQQNAKVIAKMPDGYVRQSVVKSGNDTTGFNVYPSSRMFDTISVWSDITSHRLAGMTMLQWIVIALIFDIISFILFTLFRKQDL